MLSNKALIELVALEKIYNHQNRQRAMKVAEGMYGARLMEELAEYFRINGRQMIKVGPAIIYDTLNALSEDRGEQTVLRSWWQDEALTKVRRKRYYVLTEYGYRYYIRMKNESRERIFNSYLLYRKVLDDLYE